MRFELMRENPNGFLVHRLNRSATVSYVVKYTSRESNPGRKNGNLPCYHYTTSVARLPFDQEARASTRDRTTDLTLTKRMLYQLSYRGNTYVLPVRIELTTFRL